MWVEILSRHRDITARFRVTGAEARIGRGYDNDVIVDDPYVAAQHLRIFRDENGQLIAEDLGSANGIYLDGSTNRLARIVIDGKQPVRIGQTYVRVREPGHAVERERVARPALRSLPIILAVALSVAVLGISALDVWLAQTAEAKASAYLTPLLSIAAVVLLWAGFWAVLSRIFSGQSHSLRNLIIALTGLFAVALYNEFAVFSSYAWTWPTASTYGYVAGWAILAAVVFFHLREVGRSRLVLKGVLMAALMVAGIAMQTLQRSEAFTDFGRQNVTRRLLPPALRLVALRDEGTFFADIAKLKGKLDADRKPAADPTRQ